MSGHFGAHCHSSLDAHDVQVCTPLVQNGTETIAQHVACFGMYVLSHAEGG
jgi:hypothetical protein